MVVVTTPVGVLGGGVIGGGIVGVVQLLQHGGEDLACQNGSRLRNPVTSG